MATEQRLTGLARRERKGSEKRKIGYQHIKRMLPTSIYVKNNGELPKNAFTPDVLCMGMEDSYCDMWDRTEVIDARTRSLATVAMMIGVGNVGNQFELGFHAPGAIYNGVTVEEIEAILAHARVYVGSPAGAWAGLSIVTTLKEHGLVKDPRPEPDLDRRERTGSEKREIGRQVLREMEPDSPLLNLPEQMSADVFAAELDYMVLENCYADLWARNEVLDRKSRSIVTLGMLIGLSNHAALRAHVPVAIHNGLTVQELEEIVYQAATYLGYPTGLTIRATVAAGVEDAGRKKG